MNTESSLHRKIRLALSGSLLILVYLLISPMNALSQTSVASSKGILSRLTENHALTYRASFTYSPGYPMARQSVQFLDTSSGNPTSWLWNFGDGTTSTEQNPTHEYLKAGFRRVILVASYGTSSKKAVKTITIMPAPVPASFVFSPATPEAGQTVQFADTSSGDPKTWLWDFGDGTTSTVKNPSHAYSRASSYVAILISSGSSGSKQGTDTITVTAIASPIASFTSSPTSPLVGEAVQFADTSAETPTSWQWNFSDGSTSTTQNPSHAFATSGSKTVALTVTNASGSNSTSRTITVVTALAASFTHSPASPAAGQAVQFTDTSVGAPTSWQWSFGDGTTSTAQNPSHAYSTAGAKTVTLTSTNASGSNSSSRTVTVTTALAASFSFSPASPAAGQAVQFTDTSAGSPISWQWNFGDGTTSTLQNPSHTYTMAGSKTVMLTVTNTSGLNSTSRVVTILATLTALFSFSPASPSVGQSVQFTDTSAGTPTSWRWDFNDGTSSTSQNPSHAFTTAGMYNVTLAVTNASSSKSTSQSIIVAPSSTLIADFTYTPSSPVLGQMISFSDASTGIPISWQWEFGDGVTSSTQNPAYTFATAGAYPVTLTVGTGSSCNSTIKTITVGYANVITAASPSFADVSSAISSANPGDTVIVPAGSATWSSQLAIRKGINLTGAGIGITVITSGYSGSYLVKYEPSDYNLNTPFRLSGFTFDLNGQSGWLELGSANKQAPFTVQDKIRIDHNRIINPQPTMAAQFIWNYCNMYGVVDNNSMEGGWYFFKSDTQGTESGWWDNSPQNIFVSGSNNYMYFEDNFFAMTGTDNILSEAQYSGRYVFRYNTITGAASYSLFELHGHQTSGAMGSCFGAEVYGNQITAGLFPLVLFKTRGGKSFVFFNSIMGSGHFYNVGYTSLVTCPTSHSAEQMIHDTYWFQNRSNYAGNLLSDEANGSISCNGLTGIPMLGRDIITNSTAPGVTCGPLANRPATCQVHQGYWATDQPVNDLTGMVGVNPATPISGTLYKCTAPNVWTPFYTPYPYPHPVRTLLSTPGQGGD